MKMLIKRLLLPGYDLEKERAIQEAIVALRRLDAENKSMQAKIEQTERQEPAAEWGENRPHHYTNCVPEDIIRDAVRYRFLRAAKNIPISSKAARDPVVYDAAIDAAMLAAAPEAKRDAP